MSPRLRRLRSDQKAMEQLKAESQILDYTAPGPMFGGPPETYSVRFHGLGVWRPGDSDEVEICERHEVLIRLGASYPRMMPELIWKTPIFHPNISANGVVCLGGYSTHWVPSLQLDELCTMLWDMIRYENFDVDSPYNRAAAQWAKEQETFQLPLDRRALRDASPFAGVDDSAQAQSAGAGQTQWLSDADLLPTSELLAAGDKEPVDDLLPASEVRSTESRGPIESRGPADSRRSTPRVSAEIMFVGDEVIEAEVVEAEIVQTDESSRTGAEILFIE